MARPDVTTFLRRGQMTRRRMLAGSVVVALGALTGRARAALRGELVSGLSVDNGGSPFAGDRTLFATLSPGRHPWAEARDRPLRAHPPSPRRAAGALPERPAVEGPLERRQLGVGEERAGERRVAAAQSGPPRAHLGAAGEPRSGHVHPPVARDRPDREADGLRHGDARAPAPAARADRAPARARCGVPAVELRAGRRDDDVRRRRRARADGAALPVRPRAGARPTRTMC